MSVVSLNTIAGGSGGFSVLGRTTASFGATQSGFAVSFAGDMNGDGFGEIIIGAPGDNETGGAAFVLFGSAAGFGSPFSLDTLTTAQGFVVEGGGGNSLDGPGDQMGFSVSGAGDINGDGFDDVLIGSPTFGAADDGRVTVVFGHAGAPATFTPVVSSVIPQILPLPADQFGWSVSDAGDVNGDGFADAIVGTGVSGNAHVYFGNAAGLTPGFSVLARTGANGTQQTTPVTVSTFVSSAGDVNGDTFDDLIVGARNADGTGESYVLFGHSGAFGPINLNAPLAGLGFTINGENVNDRAGSSVSSAGDVNRDGFADLIIGAWGADGAHGVSYLVFGHAGAAGTFGTLDLATMTPAQGFEILGQPGPTTGEAGWSVSSAGDFNADGFDDLFVGAPFADGLAAGDFAGRAYVIYGGSTLSGPIQLATIGVGTAGVAFVGEVGGDWTGFAVSAAGDVNGDGGDDLIIGAPNGLEAYGKSFVIYGEPKNVPTANPDTRSVFEYQTATGNVVAGDAFGGQQDTDIDGDSLAVTAITGFNGAGTVGTSLAGHYGHLTIQSDGSYSYIADQAEPLAFGATVQDVFTYTVSDSITPVNTTLTVTVTGSNIGNAAANQLLGSSGPDPLFGDLGNDTMSGASGDDFFEVDDSGDVVIEQPGQGTNDRIWAFVDYTLPTNVENLVLQGAAVTGIGNSGDNVIRGNDLDNFIYGAGGHDVMFGGKGNDFFEVDSSDDQVVELPGEGFNDRIWSLADYVLPVNVESLTLIGSAEAGTGNAEGNVIRGNAIANRITGAGGDDLLFGEAGGDTFVFGLNFGHDVLADFQGGAGPSDTLEFSKTVFANEAGFRAASHQIGADVVVVFNAANHIVLANTTVAQIHSDDLLFV